MRLSFITLIVLALTLGSATAKAQDNALWITGDVFMQEGLLLFRADKPVQGNSIKNIVLIGPTKDAINIIGPILMRIAERHVKLRFYGVLQPVSAHPPGKHKVVPTVQFIVWKLHDPSEPDELSAGKVLHLAPDSQFPATR